MRQLFTLIASTLLLACSHTEAEPSQAAGQVDGQATSQAGEQMADSQQAGPLAAEQGIEVAAWYQPQLSDHQHVARLHEDGPCGPLAYLPVSQIEQKPAALKLGYDQFWLLDQQGKVVRQYVLPANAQVLALSEQGFWFSHANGPVLVDVEGRLTHRSLPTAIGLSEQIQPCPSAALPELDSAYLRCRELSPALATQLSDKGLEAKWLAFEGSCT